MPRMPLNDERRRSPLRRLWVPVRSRFATACEAVQSYGYLDRSLARDCLRIIGCVDRPFSLRLTCRSPQTAGGDQLCSFVMRTARERTIP